MTTYIYCRVSTKEQAADGASLPTQERECRRWAEDRGLELGTETNSGNPGVFVDPGVSAWKIPLLTRPGFQALWLTMKPGDNFICLSLDRAFRSVHDFSRSCHQFESAEINPIFIRDRFDMRTATGKLMAHMCAAFAQFKSDLISQRVKEGNQRAQIKSKDRFRIVQAQDSSLVKYALAGDDDFQMGLDIERGRVHSYARVSTGDQTVDSQMETIDRTVVRMAEEGYEIGFRYEDHGVSAFSVDWKDRPDGQQLWNDLQPHDCVVVSRLDRIFRSVSDMAFTTKSLIDRDIHLVTGCGLDTRTEFGRQGIEVMAMMASWESRDLSWRMKMVFKNRRALYGKWKSEKQRPRWMKVVYVEGGWTLHPDMNWLAQYQEVREMRESGLTNKETSDLMEERLAAREMRPILPIGRFRPLVFRRGLGKKYTDEQIKNYKAWLKRQTPDKNGEVERDWSHKRVHNASMEFDAIQEFISQ